MPVLVKEMNKEYPVSVRRESVLLIAVYWQFVETVLNRHCEECFLRRSNLSVIDLCSCETAEFIPGDTRRDCFAFASQRQLNNFFSNLLKGYHCNGGWGLLGVLTRVSFGEVVPYRYRASYSADAPVSRRSGP